jgi:hypothetical protein
MTIRSTAAVLALGAAGWFFTTTRGDASARKSAPAGSDRPPTDDATRTFLLYGLIPFWMLPGLGDYLCHRKAKIETTSGTHESLTHVLMIATTGVELGAALLLEVNAPVLIVMTIAACLHEAIVIWDVAYASQVRMPSATEQHVHSFLEVLPFTALAFIACRHPDAVAAVFRRGDRGESGLRFKLRTEPIPYLAAIGALGTVTLLVPFLEEFVRCYRRDCTLLPHRPPKA